VNIRCHLIQVRPNLCAFDNGSEFINEHLLDWCNKRQITFTRSRPGNSNDGCHVEQKNWAIVRIVVGHHRYDTKAELLLLNKIWVLQSKLTNYLYPQQKLVSKVRTGAKVSKKYDTATTPHRRAERHQTVTTEQKTILADTYTAINPAAVQRQTQALSSELLTLTTSKAGPKTKAPVGAAPTRASSDEATTQRSRASGLRYSTGFFGSGTEGVSRAVSVSQVGPLTKFHDSYKSIEAAGSTPLRAGSRRRRSRRERNTVSRNLQGKVALITGAARGQGRSHAVRLAQEGVDIIAIDIAMQIDSVPYPLATPEDLELTRKEVDAIGRGVFTAQADVRDFDALKAAVDAGVAELGRLDIVIANAGIVALGADEPDPTKVFIDTLMTNLTGVRHTVHAAVDHLIGQGDGGAIVITSSTQGLTGRGGNGSGALDGYVASKHGVVGLMRSYANWLAPHNIRVNTVHPTGVNTQMVLNESTEAFLASGAAAVNAGTNLLPVGRLEASDITDAVVWLVSDEARYVTGVTLPVDAGFTAK
jgi:SDR family mycofactocin-dependent oxidoreductase